MEIGVLGPNGAGKTTLINLVAGLARPTSGAVRWRGDASRRAVPARDPRAIGMVTQETALYDELTVRQNLRFAADLYGVEHRNNASPRCSSSSASTTRVEGPRRVAVGRHAAPARARPRAAPRPGAARPRRADARRRRRGAPRALGPRALAAPHRQDRPAQHEPSRRGRGAVRPHRRPARGRSVDRGRSRRAARADRSAASRSTASPAASPASASERSPALPGVGRIDVTEVGITVHVAARRLAGRRDDRGARRAGSRRASASARPTWSRSSRR